MKIYGIQISNPANANRNEVLALLRQYYGLYSYNPRMVSNDPTRKHLREVLAQEKPSGFEVRDVNGGFKLLEI